MARGRVVGRLAGVAGFAALTLLGAGGRALVDAQERPLPEPEAFYRTVRNNLTRSQGASHLFAYRERRTDVHTNPFGRLGTGGMSVFDVYPSAVGRLTYRRLVERNGTAVPAAELAEQDRQYRARVTEVERENTDQTAGDRRREANTRRRDRAQQRVDDVISTLTFTMRGRTTSRGAPTIVIDFAPKPNAQPTTREGRIAQKFKGTVWVDEATVEVVRIEATSFDAISFGYGLVARLGEGTTATMTRVPVGDGFWMPTELTLKGQGRAAIFRRLVMNFSVEWSGYRRLSGESLTPFLDAGIHRQTGSGPQ